MLKGQIAGLNQKIEKLYNWHLMEVDLVAKQQQQLRVVSEKLQQAQAQVQVQAQVQQTPGVGTGGGAGGGALCTGRGAG